MGITISWSDFWGMVRESHSPTAIAKALNSQGSFADWLSTRSGEVVYEVLHAAPEPVLDNFMGLLPEKFLLKLLAAAPLELVLKHVHRLPLQAAQKFKDSMPGHWQPMIAQAWNNYHQGR